MKISFFEEYANSKNLSKLSLIKFPTKLYLADYNIDSYKQYKKELQDKYKNLKEVIWWSVLNVHEGYWLSPWTKRRALLRIFHNLLNEKIPILWDAEFPKNRKLIFTQFFKHFKNRKLIKAFFEKYKGDIYTAEYFIAGKLMKKILDYSCLSFDTKEYENLAVVKMMYTSMHPWINEKFIKNEIKDYRQKYNDKFAIGLGVLATGINGNEPVITPKQLERDLRICKELKIKEVIIYRLGGLNKEYTKIIPTIPYRKKVEDFKNSLRYRPPKIASGGMMRMMCLASGYFSSKNKVITKK